MSKYLIVAIVAAGVVVAAPAATPGKVDSAFAVRGIPSDAAKAYGRLPLAFVPNAGQTDLRVRYQAQVGGASFYFTPREAVFSFAKERQGVALRLRFLGATRNPRIERQRLGPGRVNYLIGNDPAKWRTNLPAYRQVVYRDLWPGIDLAFRGQGGRLKYEFRLAPGASVRDIRLAYRGANRVSVGPSGELRIGTALGVLSDSRPASYQPVDGKRVPVASRYALDGNVYGFALGAHDPSRPLVIDPGLVYSTYLGGSSSEAGLGIAVDAALPSPNAYVTGVTSSTNFPTTIGPSRRPTAAATTPS